MSAATRITVRAHAKINLDLRILGRRADGFHELRTVFQSLAWHDTVTVTRARGSIEIAGNATRMPLDHTNLAWRAAEALWSAAGSGGDPPGVRIGITKRIPAQAGLGGGSSDAAAVLVALNRLWRTRLSRPQLARVAAALGSDVAFFLVGGTALGLGRGDELYPLANLPSHQVVVAWPSQGVSTADAYGWFTGWQAATRHGERASLWDAGDADTWANDLQAPVEARRPEIRRIRRLLEGSGARVARMSGSGSAVFGLFHSAATASRAMKALGVSGSQAVLTRTLARSRLVV